ncbi:MAG: Hint domain-containing protein [Pseudomonadota bacterium]
MPEGYLVTLGDGQLGVGDSIGGPLTSFTTNRLLGTGNWQWSGTWNGSTFTNEEEPGEYFLATNGNVYFVPAFGPVDNITSASVTSTQGYDGSAAVNDVRGTAADDDLDGDGNAQTLFGEEGADTIDAGGGADTVFGGEGGDDISGQGGSDSLVGGDGNDTIAGDGGADTLRGGTGDDLLEGGSGADSLVGGSGNDSLEGGAGADVLYGDEDPNESTTETLRWSEAGSDGFDLGEGFTQFTGQMAVTVSVTNNGNLTSAQIDTVTDQYTEGPDNLSDFSSLELAGGGGTDTATTTIDFAATGDGDTSDEVENVLFRVNDVDSAGWIDTLEINAFDADGNAVTVSITAENTGNVVSGNEVTSGVANGSANSQSGSVLVEIAGPIASVEISYGNDGSSGQRIWLTDVNFDTIPLPAGDDTLDGGLGADTMFGGAGADTFAVADADEAYGEEGDDLFLLGDFGEGSSSILIDGGEGGESAGDTIDLNGQASLSDVSFDPGNSENGTITLIDGSTVTFSNIENIICFTPGTTIATPRGARPVESLRPGDLVLTRDNGIQPIRWVGQRTVPAMEDFAPIEVAPSVLSGATAPLLVSPQHRLLFSGFKSELLFGEREVLVAAKHLLDGHAVRQSPRAEVTYIHIMFDRHELVFANGAATESFFAGDSAMDALEGAAREELFSVFPELRSAGPRPTARRALKRYEAALLS